VKFISSPYRFLFFLLFATSFVGPLAFGKDPAKMVRAGIQYKPIFPVEFLGTGTQSLFDQNVKYDITLQSGFSGGMVIRKGFTELLAVEGGINYVKRKYRLDITDGSYKESSQFRVVGYEIPLSLVVYIRLGEYLFMNASMGAAADMFASNVESAGENHFSFTVKKRVVQPAVIANLGWEVRTNKAGFFYLGASFHRPFEDVFATRIRYKRNSINSEVGEYVSGSYLTFDIRYFFPEGARVKPE
jgi:hypothetical protein